MLSFSGKGKRKFVDERTSEISEGFVILLLMLMRNYLSSHRHQRVDSSFSDNDPTKKLIFCLLLIQNTSPLIKDSDEDSECVDNDTEQLIVLLFSLIVIQPVLCQRMLFQYS